MRASPFLVLLIPLGLLPACRRSVDWNAKDAWRHCQAAIAAWPETPAPDCPALHLCANEAPLSPAEREKLDQMFRAQPACPAP